MISELRTAAPRLRRALGLSLTLLLLLCVTACSDGEADAKPTGPTTVPVLNVVTQSVTAHESYPAKIEGVVNSAVRPKSTGYVTEVLVDEGERVTAGQLLFKLETKSLDGEAAAARANVNAAKVEVEKLKPLVEQSIISNVQLETARARLAQAQSSYSSVAANIGYSNIKSPVDGVVGSINFRRGALVSGQDPLPLTQVSSIESVYANFAMNEAGFLTFVADAAGETMQDKIKNLPPVTLVLANGKEYDKPGTIETISGEIDQATGTVSFRAKFDNSAGILRNGSSGTIKIPEVLTDMVVVPVLSTFEQQGDTFVYVVQGDTLKATAIEIVAEVDNLYVVAGGLEAGAAIVARGANKLKSSTKVTADPVTMESIMESFSTVFR